MPFVTSFVNPEHIHAAGHPSEDAPRYDPSISLIADSGFSFTHAVPVFSHQPINYGIRRLNVGGKLLTNLLKETVSFRHYNMMDEV